MATETATKTDEDLFRERMRLSGDLSGMAYEHLSEKLGYNGRSFEGEKYQLVDDEEYKALGYDPDDPWGPLVIKRESDGQCFELDVEVEARRVPPPAGRMEAGGRMTIAEAAS